MFRVVVFVGAAALARDLRHCGRAPNCSLLAALVIAALVIWVPSVAGAISLRCPPPTILVGNTDPGSNPVVSANVRRQDGIGGIWSVEYRFADGEVVLRSDQYPNMSDASSADSVAWVGNYHANPSLRMIGEIIQTKVGAYVYRERVFDDAKGGRVIVDMSAECDRIDQLHAPAPGAPVGGSAEVYECGPATVMIGEAGRNSVVATTVTYDRVRLSVIHHLADSKLVARETQYEMVVAPNTGAVKWAGHLNRNHDLYMVGQLSLKSQTNRRVYEEFLYDQGHGNMLVMHSQTFCNSAATTVVQSAPPQPESPGTPAPPQPSAPLSIPHTNSVPIYFEDNRHAVYVDVILGSQPAHMLIDTGATDVTVSESIAQELLLRGEAEEGPIRKAVLADGSTMMARHIYVHTLKIGENVLSDVLAGITPDGTDMLLGFPVLNQVGRFTIDTKTNRLIFG